MITRQIIESGENVTKNQLIEVMIYYAEAFSLPSIEIIKESIHKDILLDSFGVLSQSGKRVYKASVRWNINAIGLENKDWPKNEKKCLFRL